jgi:hypothetical protein
VRGLNNVLCLIRRYSPFELNSVAIQCLSQIDGEMSDNRRWRVLIPLRDKLAFAKILDP